MRLYRTTDGVVAEYGGAWRRVEGHTWADLISRDDLPQFLQSLIPSAPPCSVPDEKSWLAPLEAGEVWAAGVTYYRSRTARMEESQAAGGGNFYDRVYTASRPELFFKSTPHRTVGPGSSVHIRSDSRWNVPEPELALMVTPRGTLIGYTIGNDMSSRDIEGENPLYLPQAKVYERSCALGPAVLVTSEALPETTKILLEIRRGSHVAFRGETALSEMKRKPQELIEYLFRDNTFPQGCILLTGTGIIPPDDFTLLRGDEIRIAIDRIGVLVNSVD